MTRVRGIVNGTTNFILSAMTDEDHPVEFAAALAEAERLGYAEADPSGDVEGHDAVNKLVILARLGFDQWLDPTTIPTRPDGADGPAGPGISTVSLGDEAHARAAGRIIRPVATAAADPDGVLRAAVLPTALPLDSALGRTAGVRNRIEVDAIPVGRVGFDGPGAGGPATSSAVLGDLIAVGRAASFTGPRREARAPSGDAVSRPETGLLTTASGIRYPIDDWDGDEARANTAALDGALPPFPAGRRGDTGVDTG